MTGRGECVAFSLGKLKVKMRMLAKWWAYIGSVRRLLLFALAVVCACGLAAQQSASGARLQLLDPAGAEIPGVSVQVVRGINGPVVVNGMTGADGTVVVLLPAGRYTVTAAGQGYKTAAQQIEVAGRGVTDVSLRLDIAGSCTGNCDVALVAPEVELEALPARAELLAALPARGGTCPVAGRWLRRVSRR